MQLFIAEKPDLAKAIVDGLGGGSRKDGFYDCGDSFVTWCYGHMLQLLDPEDYDPRFSKWNMDDLPISHIPWQKKPSNDKKDQLKIITTLLKQASSVVHAGDPDEEGQLLVDEILEYASCSLPVKRLLINDNNISVVKRSLASMRDNREFAGLSAAAEARSVGDQLYGYNMSRAYTLAANKAGFQGVLSVGRVQTPILGLVVRRDREFEAHTKSYYYNVIGQFAFSGLAFPARYQVVDGDPVDEKGRLSNQDHAQGVADAAKGSPAKLVSASTKKKEQHPPLPYNLLKLQTDASRKFGMKPNSVKDITQSLREKHKLITYNRSDCEYLSEDQHADAPNVLAAIAKTAPTLTLVAQRADPSLKSRAFNSSKVSAHHGIIPTEATADFSNLTDGEQKIYMLIARAYIAQFWPKHQYDQTDIILEAATHRFAVRSNVTTLSGWKALYRNDIGNEDLEGDANDIAQDLRVLKAGEGGDCTEAVASKMETKPRPLYTMATLLTDLTRVAQYVRDDRLRKLLIEKDKGKEGEHGGIGTPATRDTIIATLFDRGYLMEKGNNIISTPTGREFYDTLPDKAKYPDMTALWHEQQRAIQSGDINAITFVTELMEYIGIEVANVKQNGIGIKVAFNPCPDCGKPLRRIKKKDKNEFFWGCTGFSDGCRHAAEDKDGRPVPKQASLVSDVHKCMSCGKGLSRRPGRKKGAFWWGCSGFPTCKQTYQDVKGKPDFNISKQGGRDE
ncbi:DNA topoisomerase 3 (plasmid) [Methylomonas sp. LL1]|uniref:DNA topoisomerase 3 n=1 Tax=Methylomonas sp. LL1 TaxID=2785785 RepID=UPI0018C43E63|nr:DNA topoisomerase 3 [Methylomonas sp. LL1]QPK61431.1 DNA topoisomerase 3 [Methylomonas sp. LL1]